MIKLYNSRTKKVEEFHSITPNLAKIYSCGPTVYDFAHIGNFRTAIFVDILKKTLILAGFEVLHIMNITDVGHLTGDGDLGEDRLEIGSRREKKTAWDIAKFYENAYKKDFLSLNLMEPSLWPRATEHIPEQIKFVEELGKIGVTYETTDGIYFDTSKIEDYGEMVNIKNQTLEAGKRVEMGEKRNQTDFALWKFSKDGENRQMEWDAFQKKGFPGWHIECSAMAQKYLGDTFDIHTGGIDLSRTHHINEIAQSETLLNKKPYVNFWLHGEFLLIRGEKMSKSVGNLITVQTLKNEGFDPISYRFFVLQAHFQKQLNFTFEALKSAEIGLKNLRREIEKLEELGENKNFREKFRNHLFDNLNTAEAIAFLFKSVDSGLISKEDVVFADKVLSLNLITEKIEIPEEILNLIEERKKAREDKNWSKSDELRTIIENLGFILEDQNGNTVVRKK